MARRSATASGVVLSHVEFDLLWEDLGSGEAPYPLSVPSHGVTMDERAQLGQRVFDGLADAGLADGDEVAPDLAEMFTLLGESVLSVDALVVADEPWRMLAATGGGRGVLAVLDGREVALEPLYAGDLVSTVSRIIGEASRGPGERVRMPRSAFAAAMDGYARAGYPGFETALSGAGVTGRAVRPLATMVTSVRHAAGQLAANGARGRTPVTSWFDTEAGRYAVTGEDIGGEEWVTVTPAGGMWMANQVTALVESVQG